MELSITSEISARRIFLNALMFKTANSVYRIEYVKKEKTPSPEYLTGTLDKWR